MFLCLKKMRSKNPLEDGELGVFNKKHVHLCSKVQLLSL